MSHEPESGQKNELPKDAQAEKEDAKEQVAKQEHKEFHEVEEDIFKHANFGSNVPLSDRESQHLEKRGNAKPLTFDQITKTFQDAIQGKKPWSEALKTIFSFMFGADTRVEGLGHYVKNLDAIPLNERIGLVKQMEQHAQEQMNPIERVRVSLLQSETELSILKKYNKQGTKMATEVVEIAAGDTLEKVMEKRGPEAVARWKELQPGKTPDGRDQDPEVAGPLNSTRALPQGFLYFSKEGYPLFITKTKQDPSAVPATPFYRRKSAQEQQREAQKSEYERRMEYLRQNVQAGDMILVNQDPEAQDAGSNLLGRLIRRGTSQEADERQFPHTHAMMYMGDGSLAHLSLNGAERRPLQEFVGASKKYTSITVIRLEGASADERRRFAEEGWKFLMPNGKPRAYNVKGLLVQGLTGVDNTVTEDSGVCIDVASEGGKAMAQKGGPNAQAWQEFSELKTPIDLLRKKHARAVLSVDFTPERKK